MKHLKSVTAAKPSVAKASVFDNLDNYLSHLFGRVFDIGGVRIKIF